jgi:hypothetical protein
MNHRSDKEAHMRHVIFKLALLLLVVVLVASLGAPGATASTLPVTSPRVSQVTAEHSMVKSAADSNTLRTGTLFEAWPWPGTATSPATMARPGSDGGKLGQVSMF